MEMSEGLLAKLSQALNHIETNSITAPVAIDQIVFPNEKTRILLMETIRSCMEISEAKEENYHIQKLGNKISEYEETKRMITNDEACSLREDISTVAYRSLEIDLPILERNKNKFMFDMQQKDAEIKAMYGKIEAADIEVLKAEGTEYKRLFDEYYDKEGEYKLSASISDSKARKTFKSSELYQEALKTKANLRIDLAKLQSEHVELSREFNDWDGMFWRTKDRYKFAANVGDAMSYRKNRE